MHTTSFAIRTGLWRAASLVALLALAAVPVTATAQGLSPETDTTADARKNPYGTGAGFEILLTNNGFGLGGYYNRALNRATSFLMEASIGAGKDEREVKFFGYFGRSYIPNKANYLLMLPVQAGIQQRLFQDMIEENFRPYLQLTGGPTLGWEYPYFRDCNGNGRFDNPPAACEEGEFERSYDAIGALPKGALRLGMGGTIALGAHFGLSKKMTQGVRIGYAFNYFFQGIELLEEGVPGAVQNFFGTPTISLTFGKLF